MLGVAHARRVCLCQALRFVEHKVGQPAHRGRFRRVDRARVRQRRVGPELGAHGVAQVGAVAALYVGVVGVVCGGWRV